MISQATAASELVIVLYRNIIIKYVVYHIAYLIALPQEQSTLENHGSHLVWQDQQEMELLIRAF